MFQIEPYNNNVTINDEPYITDTTPVFESAPLPVDESPVYVDPGGGDPIYIPLDDNNYIPESEFPTDTTPTTEILPGEPTPQQTGGNKIMDWIKANPLLTLLIAAGIYEAVKTSKA